MRMDKLTSKFQMALADAQSLALGRDHQFHRARPPDAGTARPAGRHGAPAAREVGRQGDAAALAAGEALDRLPKVEGTGGEVHVSNDLSKLLNLTDKIAQKRGDQYISSEIFISQRSRTKGRSGPC